MKIIDIITEEADAGSTMSGNIASVSFPMTPGTTKKAARKAVDPNGYLGDGKRKKPSVGYTEEVKVIKR